MEEATEPPLDTGPLSEISTPLSVPKSSPDFSRQSLIRQQAARIQKGQSLSPSFLGRRLRNSSSRNRHLLPSIPEARVIRKKLSSGFLDDSDLIGNLEGRPKRKGARKSRIALASGTDNSEGEIFVANVVVLESELGDGKMVSVSESGDEKVGGGEVMEVGGVDVLGCGLLVSSVLGQEVQGVDLGVRGLLDESGVVTGVSSPQDRVGVSFGEHQIDGGGMAGEMSVVCSSPKSTSQTLASVEAESSEEQRGGQIPVDGEMLDVLAAQPLQGRGLGLTLDGPQSQDVEMTGLLEDGNAKRNAGNGSREDLSEGLMDEEFPPLGRGRIKSIMASFERGEGLSPKGEVPLKEGPIKGGQPGEPSAGSQPDSLVGEVRQSNVWSDLANSKGTAAQRFTESNVSQRSKNAVPFEPGKFKEIGHAGTSHGLPSIFFSKSDNDFLAERLGHAIVGKFSHSIPTSYQIQKTLDGIKFVGAFSWKFINAKHVIIQFQKIADYATLLNGPNGLPVWFVDRHLMRVFKWTTEFDPFFETPIAAVWCNLIGLPIHLYDTSALYAIGSLLGTPIQVDHATHEQSRLSFARLCIEIDISTRPPEEIVIDILGREVRQKVMWDRIPSYCTECRHVGHSIANCYAFGKRDPPLRRDFNRTSHNQNFQGGHKGPVFSGRQNSHRQEGLERGQFGKGAKGSSLTTVTSNSFQVLASVDTGGGGEYQWREKASGAASRVDNSHIGKDKRQVVDEEGFQLVRPRKNRVQQHVNEDLNACFPDTYRVVHSEKGVGVKLHSRSLSPPKERGVCTSGSVLSGGSLEKPTLLGDKLKFYKVLDNGDFDTGSFEEEEVMEEDDPGGTIKGADPGREQRIIEGEVRNSENDCNNPKKARLSALGEAEISS